MDDLLNRSWWLLAVQGIVAVAFGVLAILWPGITLLWLVALFAAYALLQGAAAIFTSVRGRRNESKWWVVLLLGIVSVAAGILAILYPTMTALTLVLLMGANAVVTGVLQVVAAVRLRKQIRSEWLLMASGIISVIFGALVLVFPAGGALALVWLVSFYAVLTGVLLLTLALRARRWQHAPASGLAGQPAAAAHHP